MKKQTYDNYYRDYYHNNKERINENAKAYKKRYNRTYYLNNRLKKLEARIKNLKAVKVESGSDQKTL